jgi:hypothetical protein
MDRLAHHPVTAGHLGHGGTGKDLRHRLIALLHHRKLHQHDRSPRRRRRHAALQTPIGFDITQWRLRELTGEMRINPRSQYGTVIHAQETCWHWLENEWETIPLGVLMSGR